MEYITGNFNNISIVSSHFYDLLLKSSPYQNICKRILFRLLNRKISSDSTAFLNNIEDCIKLIKDKNYIDQLLLKEFFFVKKPMRTTKKIAALLSICYKYSPSLLSTEYNMINCLKYNSQFYDDIVINKEEDVEIIRSEGIYFRHQLYICFEIDIDFEVRFFDYDEITLEKIYLPRINFLSHYVNSIEFFKDKFTRKEVLESRFKNLLN